MRLLAAVRLAASGSFRKAASARSRSSKSSGEAGRVSSTASNISVVTAALALDVPGAQALHHVAVDLVDASLGAAACRRAGRGPRRTESSAVRISSRRSSATPVSIRMRSTPSAARRSPNGSFAPVGFWPIAKMPTRVSSLSATASARPAPVAGRASPAKRGRYCSASAVGDLGVRRRRARSSGPSRPAVPGIPRPWRSAGRTWRVPRRAGRRSRVLARRPGRSAPASAVIRAVLSASEPSWAWKVTLPSAVAPGFEGRLAVGGVEKRGIRKPRPHDALVAGADLGRIPAFDIGDRDEERQQPSVLRPDREIPLVVLQRRDQHFRRQFEEARFEAARQRHRPFDQRMSPRRARPGR